MNKFTWKLLIVSIGLFISCFVSTKPVWAQAQPTTTTKETPINFSLSIVPTKCWQSEVGCNICDITLIFTNAANLIAGIVGGVSLLMFIIGGLLLIFSSGNEQRIESGKKILVGTVTGLVIVFLAWFAVNVTVRLIAKSNKSGQATLFSSTDLWWAPIACSPAETSCVDKYVGNQCGQAGDCTGKDKTGCVCYRDLNPKGDNKLCATDAKSLQEASMEKKSCYCAIGCNLLNKIKSYNPGLEGYNWKCVPNSKSRDEFDKQYDFPPINAGCPTEKEICVGEKE